MTEKNSQKLTRYDSLWVIGLFGTAIGAGVLFLPIRAGMSGFYPLIIMAIIAFPMTYLAHRGLSRFVRSSETNKDITQVVQDSFGSRAGFLITILYFFAIYPICLAYGVGITNTVNSFMVYQLGLPEPPRALLAIILITLMLLTVYKGRAFVLKATNAITYPQIILLFVASLYLIPQWRGAALSLDRLPSFQDFLIALWLTLPVLVFSFNHSPAISSFSMDLREHYKDDNLVERKANQILLSAAGVMTLFVMFFTASCILTLTPEQLLQAKAENIPILSYLANINSGNLFLAYVGPLISFTAITSSFFGHYLGAHEGLVGIINTGMKNKEKPAGSKLISRASTLFIYVSMIIVAIINPSILGFIEDLGGPIIAAILFLMPVIAIYTVPAMKKYRNDKIANIYVFITGLAAVTSIIYKLAAN
jgi:serine transporter